MCQAEGRRSFDPRKKEWSPGGEFEEQRKDSAFFTCYRAGGFRRRNIELSARDGPGDTIPLPLNGISIYPEPKRNEAGKEPTKRATLRRSTSTGRSTLCAKGGDGETVLGDLKKRARGARSCADECEQFAGAM